MEPFTNELLTILVLICISWAGVTCIAVVVLLIIYICKSCKKRRPALFSKRIRTQSTTSTVSIENHSPSISHLPPKMPIKNLDPHKKSEAHKRRYDTMNPITERSFTSGNSQNTYQDEDYRRDDTEETTRINPGRLYGQRYQQKQYQPHKPMTDVRVVDRHTPYPPDVIAREKLMNNNRFPMDDKY